MVWSRRGDRNLSRYIGMVAQGLYARKNYAHKGLHYEKQEQVSIQLV